MKFISLFNIITHELLYNNAVKIMTCCLVSRF